jgi:rRNA-processing protein EBP2
MRDIEALARKAEEIALFPVDGASEASVPLVEHLRITAAPIEFPDVSESVLLEKAIHDQTLETVKLAMTKLVKDGIPCNRPTDFYAEMLRDDKTMDKVQAKLTEAKSRIEAVEKRKRLQAEKKFNKKAGSSGAKTGKKKLGNKAANLDVEEFRGREVGEDGGKHGGDKVTKQRVIKLAKQPSDREGPVRGRGGSRGGASRGGPSKFGGSSRGGSSRGGSFRGGAPRGATSRGG